MDAAERIVSNLREQAVRIRQSQDVARGFIEGALITLIEEVAVGGLESAVVRSIWRERVGLAASPDVGTGDSGRADVAEAVAPILSSQPKGWTVGLERFAF